MDLSPDTTAFAVLMTCVGLVVGSFLNLVAARLPRNEPILWARSRADCCGATLSAGELIPLLSWLIQRGRCRRCGGKVSARHPGIELAAGGLALWAAVASPDPLQAMVSAVFAWQLLLIALIDFDEMWLPDRLTGLLLLTGVAAAALSPKIALPDSLIGAALGFATLWMVAMAYRRSRGREGLGDGDPILFAAIGAWVGWAGLPTVLLWACAAALSWIGSRTLLGRPWLPERALPFGPWLAIGGWLTWIFGRIAI